MADSPKEKGMGVDGEASEGARRREEQRSHGSDAGNRLARALAGRDDEGGFPGAAPGEGRDTQAGLVGEEAQVLEYLGAAVLVQWNDLPTDLRRKLFRHAVSMGEPRRSVELRERIARFLHDHKDDAREPGETPRP
jgi:hypothetical protein